MKFDEFLRDDKMFEQALKCKNIEEFKKLAEKNDVVCFTEEQMNKGWSVVRAHAPSEDGSLDDEALDLVSGGGPGNIVVGVGGKGLEDRGEYVAHMTYACTPNRPETVMGTVSNINFGSNDINFG